ncbi:MAG: amidohydrolase [Sphingobacteriales bacterium]|nr:amidohydrolase [Sphingobacteriales bacterium]MBI3718816.1 amidohydrolase [Sphingobacteriales bacterium]
MRKLFRLIVFINIILVACSQKETADTIYFNAKIWTGDSAQPSAEAMAIKDNQIIFVGKDYAALKGDKTEMIDVGGKMIVPGFIDNHTHFLTGGYNLASVNLRTAKTKEEFISTLKTYCQQHPGDSWIQGGDWDHEAWGGELPNKNWIDSVTGDHPLFVSRYDGHMAFANSKALAIAKIDKNTIAPAGGVIVKDKNDEPTGVIKDEAMNLMFNIIPVATEKELDEYFQRAQQHAFENGVTQINDVGSYGGWIDMATYRRAQQNKQLDLRIYSFVALNTWQKLDSFVKKNGRGDDLLRWGGLKGFVDGSLGSTTAWFYQPYLDAPTSNGFTVTDTNDLRKWVLSADSAGLHVTVHAIGDHANDFILNVFEEAEKKNGNRDRRFRVEHAQHVTQSAFARFASLHVIPSMQPYHAIDDGRWAAKRLDDARLKGTYAFKSMLDAGATLTFGSDWTVAPLKPIEGIYAAVTRRTLDDKNPNGWYPEQKLTVEQALKCYTVNNAYAGFFENKTGKLKAGMLADFVVLSDDLFSIQPDKIWDVKVLRTVVDGKEVFISK